MGILKVLGNSDPVAYWNDAVNWCNSSNDDEGTSVALEIWYALGYLVEDSDDATELGFSLTTMWENRYDGQFGVVANNWGDAAGWETGFNWCFGPYPTLC